MVVGFCANLLVDLMIPALAIETVRCSWSYRQSES